MPSIESRLRNYAANHAPHEADKMLAEDALEEILRLKAALRQIADDPMRDGGARNIAGAALVGYSTRGE